MKILINFYTKTASRFYPYRWLLLAILIFTPFMGVVFPENLWLPAQVALVVAIGIIWFGSQYLFFTVLFYGPIQHFQGSPIWEASKSYSWLLLTIYFSLPLVGLINAGFQYVFSS